MMDNEQGSNEKDTFVFASTAAYEESFDGPLVQKWHYTENATHGALFTEDILAIMSDKDTINHCTNVRNMGGHKNIMTIIDFDNHDEDGSRVIYQYSSHITLGEALSCGYLFGAKVTPEKLQMIVSEFLSGLIWLHIHGLYHGNLKLSTTHFIKNERDEGTIKLGQFKGSVRVNLKEMLRKDLMALAPILGELLKYAAFLGYPNIHELKMLVEFLKSGHFNLSKVVSASLRGPSFLSLLDRPMYICEGVRHVIKKGDTIDDNPLKWLLKRPEHFHQGDPLRQYVMCAEADVDTLWKKLVEKNAVPRSGNVVQRMLMIVKNLINHYKDNAGDIVLVKIIGQSSSQIEQHFQRYQPRLIHALNVTGQRTNFKFSKFKGRLPFDQGVLSRTSLKAHHLWK